MSEGERRRLTPEEREARRKKALRAKRRKERRRKKIIKFCIAWGAVLAVIIVLIVVIVSAAGKSKEKKQEEAESLTAQTEITTEEPTTEEPTTEEPTTAFVWTGETAEEMIENGEAEKIVFLTFDDGPSSETSRLLDILAKHNAKVTFFVTAGTSEEYQDMITREYNEGHSVCVHTLCHDYETIYSSEEAFWNDNTAMNDFIEKKTGHRSDLLRFPGGASNGVSATYNDGIMTRLVASVNDHGFDFVDWNVSSGDGGGVTDHDELFNNTIEGIEQWDVPVVLFHDTHPESVDVIEDVITYCEEKGYTLLPYVRGIYECHHGVSN